MFSGVLQDENAKNIIGDTIRRLRVEKGVSQKELADSFNEISWVQTDMSASTLSKIERGKRCITDIEVAAFAKSLNVDIGQLYEND